MPRPFTEDHANEVRARFQYRRPTESQRDELDQGAELVNEVVEFLISLGYTHGDSRDLSRAFTTLEDFRMHMNKLIVLGGD